MCGITGFVDTVEESSSSVLESMTNVLHHRGPDDSGVYFKSFEGFTVGLGHRRLSVLDLSSHGHQPMVYENYVIAYNGEIYNFKEIRQELEKYDYRFISSSDTEVILKAYHKWGNDCVNFFNGMFAISIFDKNKNKLVLMRDRAGVKPIYWYMKDGVFLFSSELKSLHIHEKYSASLNYQGLGLYLQHGYIPQPHTIFQNTYKLKAGFILELNIDNFEVSLIKYWDVLDGYREKKIEISYGEAKLETERLLKLACEYRMVSDVPVGVFLSGGYDSSMVTALLQSGRSEKIKTFSIGFNEDRYNEATYAKEISDYLGTEHREYYCTAEDALNLLPELPNIWDEPFADNSAIPTVLVSKLAKKHVTVSLSADGGDELFAGYDKYVTTQAFYNRLKKIPARVQLSKFLGFINPDISKKLVSSSKYNKLIALLSSMNQVDVMRNMNATFTVMEVNKLLREKYVPPVTNFDGEMLSGLDLNSLDALLAVDYKTFQEGDILTKVDRATMSVSLEGREPFLDYRIIEYVSRLDSSFKIKGGEKKYILKDIAKNYLPDSMMLRPKKGFNIPLAEWLSSALNEYIEYYLSIDYIENQGIFESSEVLRIKNLYMSGDSRYANKVWVLLIFQLWFDKWMAKN